MFYTVIRFITVIFCTTAGYILLCMHTWVQWWMSRTLLYGFVFHMSRVLLMVWYSWTRLFGHFPGALYKRLLLWMVHIVFRSEWCFYCTKFWHVWNGHLLPFVLLCIILYHMICDNFSLIPRPFAFLLQVALLFGISVHYWRCACRISQIAMRLYTCVSMCPFTSPMSISLKLQFI